MHHLLIVMDHQVRLRRLKYLLFFAIHKMCD